MIYLPPDEDTESLMEFEQNESSHHRVSKSSQRISFQPNTFETFHSTQNCNHIPHKRCSYCKSLCNTPTYRHTSTIVPNLCSFQCRKQNSCPYVSHEFYPLHTSSSKSPTSICHCSEHSTKTHPSFHIAPKTIQEIQSPIEAQIVSPLDKLSVKTKNSIVTATTPVSLPKKHSPKLTLYEIHEKQTKTEANGVIIKKAIILLNSDRNSTNMSSLVNAFRNFNDDDNDFEDLQEIDDVKILDGTELIDKETGVDNLFDCESSSNQKSPTIGAKLIDLLEKVHQDLQVSNQRTVDDSLSSNGNEIDPNCDDNDSNKQIIKQCETGKDLVDACKHLSQVLSSYNQQRNSKKLL